MKSLDGHFQVLLFTFTEMYSTDSASFLSMLQSLITLIFKKVSQIILFIFYITVYNKNYIILT